MSKRAQTILEDAAKLPESDRVQLIEELVGGLEGPPGSYSSESARRMLQQILTILHLLRERDAHRVASRRSKLEALFGSLRGDPLERPAQGSFEARDEIA